MEESLMKSIDERVMELEKEAAVMRDIIERNLVSDGDFQKEIRDTLSYFKNRDLKVNEFIESEISARKDRADFWREQRSKLATSTIWGAFMILCYVVWYGVVQFAQTGGR